MRIQVFLGFAWLVVLFSGFIGVEYAPAVAVFIAAGYGVKKFLDTYWNIELKDGKFLHLDDPEPAPRRPPSPSTRKRERQTSWIPAHNSFVPGLYTPRRLARR